ncbi:MAG TPA: lysylphosphatidylglycerol synthase transmembrane domain-containing protein [Chloroflexota bacterium]|nr:lysylphosphatidylglycerol synthase transmembrane domain-containing protein [Chloroflexota bacterium]
MSDKPTTLSKAFVSQAKGFVLRAKISIIIPAVIAAGLLAIVSRIAANRGSAAELWALLQQTWVLVLILTIPYLAARALVWRELLAELGIKVPVRHMAISFAGGEITKSLPAGVYVQNYLLARLEHFGRFSNVRSSMATTAMLGLETALALPIALIFGVPHEPWLFWTLIGVVVAWIVVLFLAWMLVHHWGPDFDAHLPPWLRRVRVLAEDFLAAGGELITVKTLRSLVPVAIYMMFYVVELYAIIRAVGITSITFTDTMGIYALIILAVVLVPIPTEIGLTEFAGLGALLAYGVERTKAAVVMLGLRILATGMTIVVASIVLLVLRRELTAPAEGAADPVAQAASGAHGTS